MLSVRIVATLNCEDVTILRVLHLNCNIRDASWRIQLPAVGIALL